jgi:hypothetical protein
VGEVEGGRVQEIVDVPYYLSNGATRICAEARHSVGCVGTVPVMMDKPG